MPQIRSLKENYDEFYRHHAPFLKVSGVPEDLWPQLFVKLNSEMFDSGNYFSFEYDQETESLQLTATTFIGKHSQVFVLDHFWTTEEQQLKKTLLENEQLLTRLEALLNITPETSDPSPQPEAEETESQEPALTDEEKKAKEQESISNLPNDAETKSIELDSCSISSVSKLELDKRYKHLESLSLWGNDLSDVEDVTKSIHHFSHSLKGLWLNENPVSSKLSLSEILGVCPHLEIYNSKFTPNSSEWAVRFVVSGKEFELVSSLSLASRNIHSLSLLAQTIFPKMKRLKKLDLRDNPNLSITDIISTIKSIEGLRHLYIDEDLLKRHKQQILDQVPKLHSVNDLSLDILRSNSEPTNPVLHRRVQKVSENIWKILNPYVIRNSLSEQITCWYAMDEVGLRIPHSDKPNCQVGFFYSFITPPNFDAQTSSSSNQESVDDAVRRHLAHQNENAQEQEQREREEKQKGGCTYSILFPIADIPKGTVITRDYCRGVRNEVERKTRNIFWSNILSLDPATLSPFQSNLEFFTSQFRSFFDSLSKIQPISVPPLLTSSPILSARHIVPPIISQNAKTPLLVYTDSPLLVKNLRVPEYFTLTSNQTQANIFWYDHDVENFVLFQDENERKKKPVKVNQFRNESAVTFKNYLITTLYRAFGTHCSFNNYEANDYRNKDVDWLPVSFNLSTQLTEFIGYYLLQRERGEDDTFIVKPWNLARALETSVTDNLIKIIRLSESTPKICSKYIDTPALYNGRKFDLRYIVIVKGVDPETGEPEVLVNRMFWIRLSNKQFNITDFDDYEKHFTVMNYRQVSAFEQLHYLKFIENFEQQYGHLKKWATIEQEIYYMFKRTFYAASSTQNLSSQSKDPVMGRDPFSFGIFGLDVMITESLNPMLLEVNFSPDCTRACNYDPDFYNHIFMSLFVENWDQIVLPDGKRLTEYVVPI